MDVAKRSEIERALIECRVARTAIIFSPGRTNKLTSPSARDVELGWELVMQARNLLANPEEAVACFRAANIALSEAVATTAATITPLMRQPVVHQLLPRSKPTYWTQPNAQKHADALNAPELVSTSFPISTLNSFRDSKISDFFSDN